MTSERVQTRAKNGALIVKREGELNETQIRHVTIRFPHVDHAGIMFYPRYVELLHANFPQLPLFSTPLRFSMEFRRPNRLGDRIELVGARTDDSAAWSVTGKMNGKDHFVVRVASEDESPGSSNFQVNEHAYSLDEQVIGQWSVDQKAHLFLSRYFELLNIAVEEWFEETLQLPFHRLHVERGIGIPTANFSVRCARLPKLGDTINIRMLPVRLGQRSMTVRSWLMCGDECNIETDQTIVFVRMLENGYETIQIPANVREAFQSKMEA